MAMGYDPDSTTLIADNAITYVVQAAGNSWFLAPYRMQGSIASYEHAKVSPKGVESVNASPPNTGASATGADITPPTSTQHLYTSQLP